MPMPDYPCGLRISFDQKILDKLKLKAPNHDDYLIFTAKARVTHCSTCDDAKGEPESRVELQIEKIKLVSDGDNDEDDE